VPVGGRAAARDHGTRDGLLLAAAAALAVLALSSLGLLRTIARLRREARVS
jgi:hypothetical protein